MTEPKRWTALDRRDPRRTALPTVEVVAAADFDRLRDERDRLTEELRSEWVALARERRADLAGARRVAGVLADALRRSLDLADPHGDEQIEAALAVFDTLTEEKT